MSEEMSCKNCAHMREIKANLRDVILECREGPPEIAYVVHAGPNGNPAGVSPLTIVPRIVPETYLCGRWKSLA